MKALLDRLAHPAFVRVAGIAIGLVFVVAGLAKIGDMGAFALQVHNFRLTPIALENLVAMVLPWVEVVAGTALVLGARSRAAAKSFFANAALPTECDCATASSSIAGGSVFSSAACDDTSFASSAAAASA